MIISIIKYFETILTFFSMLSSMDFNIEGIKEKTGLNTDTLLFTTSLIFGFILGIGWSYLDGKK